MIQLPPLKVTMSTTSGIFEPDRVIRVVYKVLNKHGYRSEWILHPRERNRKNHQHFVAVRLANMASVRGIKVYVAPNGRDSSWEYLLMPPNNYVLDDVLATLQGRSVAAEEQPTTPEPELDHRTLQSAASRLQAGSVYWAIVANVTPDYAEVQLTPHIYGVVKALDWDTKFIRDLSFVQPGEKIKVMLVEVGEHGIKLSRATALQYPDSDVLDPVTELAKFKETTVDGKISLRGFLSNMDNAIWLLELIAIHHSELSGDSPTTAGGQLLIKELISELWTQHLCEKFKCVGFLSTIGPLFNALLGKGWLQRATINYNEGYYITALGWSEIGGAELYGVTPFVEPVEPEEPELEEPEEPEEPEPEEPEEEPTPITVPTQPPATATDDLAGIDTRLLTEFRQKFLRVEQLKKQIAELEQERIAVQQWIDAHPEALRQYRKAMDVHRQLAELLG